MINNIIRFFRLDLIVVLTLFTGTLFGIWMGFDPTKPSAAAFIEQQQNAIRTLAWMLRLYVQGSRRNSTIGKIVGIAN